MKKMFMGLFFFGILFCSIMNSMAANPLLTYKVDPSQSDLFIYTSNSGLFASAGHKLEIKANDISGSITFDPKSFSTGILTIKVDSASLKVNNPTPEKDKKEIEETLCNKVLECNTFPSIIFKSNQVAAKNNETHTITGDLNLHGVNKTLPIEVQIQHSDKKIEATGEFKLKQTDFNIKPPSALGGTIKVKDELKITFHIVAHP